MPSIPPTEDAQMRDAPTDDDATQPIISADEERVLKLFDRLQELQLQIALVKARNAYKPSMQYLAPRKFLDWPFCTLRALLDDISSHFIW